MPRTKPAAERESDLLDAAQALFVERGVAATTLDEITRAAGVAKGTFYLYFASKDAVVRGLQERFSVAFADRLAAAVGAEDGWPAKLDALVETWDVAYSEQVDVHDVLFHAGAAAGPVPSAVVAVVADLLRAGAEAGAFAVDDPDATGLVLYSALHGAFEAGSPGAAAPEALDRRRVTAAARQAARRLAGATAA